MSLEALKVQIIKKAWSDPAFKLSLLADSKEAIHTAFGVELPDGVELQVVEEKPNRFYLTLPPSPETADGGTLSPNGVWN